MVWIWIRQRQVFGSLKLFFLHKKIYAFEKVKFAWIRNGTVPVPYLLVLAKTDEFFLLMPRGVDYVVDNLTMIRI